MSEDNTVRDELSELQQQTAPMPSNETQQSSVDLQAEIKNAYRSMQQEDYERQQQIDHDRKMQMQKQQQAVRDEEFNAEKEATLEAIANQAKENPEFNKAVQESELPLEIVDYIVDVAVPGQAPLIVQEIANNEEVREKLSRARTDVGVKKILKSVAHDVVTGGSRGNPHPMMEVNNNNFSINSMPTAGSSEHIKDCAFDCGISTY